MRNRPNIVLVTEPGPTALLERCHRTPSGSGFEVRAPQFPLCSLADDVARLRQVLEFQDGPTYIAGHSYGGRS